jgi:hypothetical protein
MNTCTHYELSTYYSTYFQLHAGWVLTEGPHEIPEFPGRDVPAFVAVKIAKGLKVLADVASAHGKMKLDLVRTRFDDLT